MEKITAKEIKKACTGTMLRGSTSTEVSGVFIDSRIAEAKGAFFALKGDRVDGHDFITEAVEKGCSVVLSEKELAEYHENVAYIKVESTETALGDLAKYYLGKFNIKKIGVTGSTGKTSTKEMLFDMVSAKYQSLCNEGNYNNLIGLPLTVFRVDKSTEVAVFEMGMDRPGEIHRLSEIIKPHIAVVTNVGLSHLSRLKTRENILKAKGEIRDFLKKEDVLIINGDDPMMREWDREAVSFEIIKVGEGENGGEKAEGKKNVRIKDVRINNIKDLGEKGVSFDFTYGGISREIFLSAPGVHNAMNASLAIAAALRLGIDIDTAAKTLRTFKSGEKRLNIIELEGFKIIDDTYNASPDSMKAAIDVLSSVEGNRKIAVLGDMFELGENTLEYHREIGEYASKKSVDVILSVGENAAEITHVARGKTLNAVHFKDKEMLITVLAQWIREGDVILVKGSRGMAMEDITEALSRMKV